MDSEHEVLEYMYRKVFSECEASATSSPITQEVWPVTKLLGTCTPYVPTLLRNGPDTTAWTQIVGREEAVIDTFSSLQRALTEKTDALTRLDFGHLLLRRMPSNVHNRPSVPVSRVDGVVDGKEDDHSPEDQNRPASVDHQHMRNDQGMTLGTYQFIEVPVGSGALGKN